MLTDLNRVDFTTVHDQAGWVCRGCDAGDVDRVQREFKRVLQEQADVGE